LLLQEMVNAMKAQYGKLQCVLANII
jgi:hypothetical protein